MAAGDLAGVSDGVARGRLWPPQKNLGPTLNSLQSEQS